MPNQSPVTLFRQHILLIAWLQALTATFGSLYFSEIAHFIPCKLCWFQRIFMYPLVLLLGIGILRRDKRIHYYVLPMSLIGLGIALYHNFLSFGFISQDLTTCSLDVPCTSSPAIWLGFITIPLLSLTAFTVIALCMVLYWKSEKQYKIP